jgi:hypothetical protein
LAVDFGRQATGAHRLLEIVGDVIHMRAPRRPFASAEGRASRAFLLDLCQAAPKLGSDQN